MGRWIVIRGLVQGRIVSALDSLGRASTYKIAREAGLDWKTTKTYLLRLEERGEVESMRYHNKILWNFTEDEITGN